MPKEPTFPGTIFYSKEPIVGVTLYDAKKVEQTLEEVIEKTEKDEVLSVRKDNLIAKLKKQGEPNPKRFTVDPDTGQIDIDEEEGEYTQKEAMIVSASIKGKGGQYDAAIALINAAKALVPENQSGIAEKPKEFYVDPETGVIIKDSENGEYTLSEARTISQSMRKEKQAAPAPPGQKSFLERFDEMTDGQVTKKIASMFGGDNQLRVDPVDEVINRLDQADKLKQRFGGTGGGGAQTLAQSGVRSEVLKLLLEDERDRLKMQYEHETQVERNKHLGTMASTVKENLADGIQAIKMAAQEAQKTGVSSPAKPEEAPPQSFACSCGMKFSAPAGWAGQPLKCPNPACGREYTKEELLK